MYLVLRPDISYVHVQTHATDWRNAERERSFYPIESRLFASEKITGLLRTIFDKSWDKNLYFCLILKKKKLNKTRR